MKKHRFGIIVVSLLAALLAAALALLFFRAQSLDSLRESKSASVAAIDAFLTSPPRDPYENTEALSGFETKISESEIKPSGEGRDYLYTCRPTDTLVLLSQSQAWDESKLRALHAELLKNKHGEEMHYLSKIIVNAEADEEAVATHRGSQETEKFRLSFPALPARFSIGFQRDVGIITLYGGDINATVESMAAGLSHEYGHHFTFYHMFNETNMEESDYVRIRDIKNDRLRFARTSYSEYLENHEWYAMEIAAEDYVTLLGSPTTRQCFDFKDVRQRLAGEKQVEDHQWGQASNAFPQENLMIAYAPDVPGLSDYFHSFVEEEPEAGKTPERQPIDFTFKRGSRSFDLIGGRRTFVYYTVSWNTPYEGAVYTLICYDKEDYKPHPIKTARPGEKAEATIGCVTRASSKRVTWWDDGLPTGTKTFLVTAMFENGTILVSDPVDHTF